MLTLKQKRRIATQSAALQDAALTAARLSRVKRGVIPVLVGLPRTKKTPQELLAEMDQRSLLKRQRFEV